MKIEFSKLALGSAVVAYFGIIALAAWGAVMCARAGDFGSMAIVIGAATGIVGTVTGVSYAVYAHKARAENVVKIAKTLTTAEVEDTVKLAQGLGGL